MKHKYPTLLAAALLMGFVAANAAVAQAASCKGMSENVCATDSACIWVEGYQRADGRDVKPYCRNRPGKSSAELIKVPKKADS